MDSWGSVPWPTWIYLFFVAEFVLENGLILEQRLIFGHILEKNGRFFFEKHEVFQKSWDFRDVPWDCEI